MMFIAGLPLALIFRTHWYAWVWREALWEQSVLPKNKTPCPRKGLESGPNRSGDGRTNHGSTAPPNAVTHTNCCIPSSTLISLPLEFQCRHFCLHPIRWSLEQNSPSGQELNYCLKKNSCRLWTSYKLTNFTRNHINFILNSKRT